MSFAKKKKKGNVMERRRFGAPAVLPLAFAITLGACEGLLDVTLPGQVVEADLNDPALAVTLTLSAVGDFECASLYNIRNAGLWFGEFLETSGSRNSSLAALRSLQIRVYADPCGGGGSLWAPLQNSRAQGQRAVDLITGFPDASVADKTFLLATARLYEGYSIELLGETHCGVTFDGGPLMTRHEAWAEAETRFTEAIQLAGGSSAVRGPGFAGDAAAVVIAAYIGRARARLNMENNPAGVVQDASQVPTGFQFSATYDATPARRQNRIFIDNNENHSMMPHRDFLDLTIAANGGLTVGSGVPDPRVVIVSVPGFGTTGSIPARDQTKYTSRGSSIPFATWREAQLMIAEADATQSVAMINLLRTSNSGLPAGIDATAWPLPAFDATGLTAAEIETAVWEERRRELWMQGHFIGDKLRWGTPFETVNESGSALGAGGCFPISSIEVTTNENL